MANLFQAPPAAPFDVHDPNNVEIRWDRWKKRLEAYITATELGDDHQKRALLLFCTGEAVRQLFNHHSNAGDAKDCTTTSQLLIIIDHFSPKKNRTFEINKFRLPQQFDDESVGQFYTCLCLPESTPLVNLPTLTTKSELRLFNDACQQNFVKPLYEMTT